MLLCMTSFVTSVTLHQLQSCNMRHFLLHQVFNSSFIMYLSGKSGSRDEAVLYVA